MWSSTRLKMLARGVAYCAAAATIALIALLDLLDVFESEPIAVPTDDELDALDDYDPKAEAQP